MGTRRPTVELYVRSLSPRGVTQRQESVLDRLEALDRRNVIENYDVTVWGDQIAHGTAAARTDEGQAILDRIRQFQQWTTRTDRSMNTFFDSQTVDSTLTGESYEVTLLPVMAMAEYEDDTLVHVTPHETVEGEDSETLRVQDRLEMLASAAFVTAEGSEPTPAD